MVGGIVVVGGWDPSLAPSMGGGAVRVVVGTDPGSGAPPVGVVGAVPTVAVPVDAGTEVVVVAAVG